MNATIHSIRAFFLLESANFTKVLFVVGSLTAAALFVISVKSSFVCCARATRQLFAT